MKLFKFFTIVLVFSTNQLLAEDKECMDQLKGLMVTPVEKELFKTHKKLVVEYFQINCEPDGLGVNNIHQQGSVVFAHEAAHFADLGWENGIHEDLSKFDLLTASNERIGSAENYKVLPQPMDIVGAYLRKERPEMLKEESPYMSMHDGYLLDPSTIAAQNILGLATELNGYTHGTVMELRNKKYLPYEVEFTDPESGVTYKIPYMLKGQVYQLDGLFYFLYTSNLYFNLIKGSDEEKWNSFFTDKNKTFLRKLFLEALRVAQTTNFCDEADSNANIGFYVNEFRNIDRTILNDIVGEDNTKPLLCEGKNVLIEDLDDSSIEAVEVEDSSRFETDEAQVQGDSVRVGSEVSGASAVRE